MAVAIQQIHRVQIAHQDVKPSNGLIVDGVTKLGDFGHAVSSANMGEDIPVGTLSYAPPEVLYDIQGSEWSDLRAIDLYLLGSLVASVFLGGVPFTVLWLAFLDDDLHPANFGDAYDVALPFVMEAMGSALDFLRQRVPKECDADLIVRIVRHLCSPDLTKRGMPDELVGQHDPQSLRRVIQTLDLMEKRHRVRATA